MVLLTEFPSFPLHLDFSLPPSTAKGTERLVPRHKSIHDAAQHGDSKDVALFIDRGVDVNAFDRNGLTPLHCACVSNNRNQHKIVHLLLKHGANPSVFSSTGQTALHVLVESSKSPSTPLSFKLILSTGIYVDIFDEIGRTPLDYMLLIGGEHITILKLSLIKILVDHNAGISDNLGRGDFLYMLALILMYSILKEPADLENANIKLLDRTYLENSIRINDTTSRSRKLLRVLPRDLLPECIRIVDIWRHTNLNAFVTVLDFLKSDEETIAQLSTDYPQLYFALKPKKMSCQNIFFPIFKFQFDIFCYYLVKVHLPLIQLSHGGIKLNYDCVRIIASFMDLNDLVNLCRAFNYPRFKRKAEEMVNETPIVQGDAVKDM